MQIDNSKQESLQSYLMFARSDTAIISLLPSVKSFSFIDS